MPGFEWPVPPYPPETRALREWIAQHPEDARAPYYLGNLLYENGQREEAITWWEKAVQLERAFPGAWRNLGLGYYHVLHDKLAAKGAYHRAFKNSLTWSGAGDGVPRGNAQFLFERDQLWKRTLETPAARLAELEQYLPLIAEREDLTLEYCTLLNQLQRHEEALALLTSRRFQPVEAPATPRDLWARTHLGLGRRALWREGGNPQAALGHFEAALHPPENLGAVGHLQQNQAEAHHWAGMAAKAGHSAAATPHFEAAAAAQDADFMDASYWRGMALRELGRHAEARALFEAMLNYAEGLKISPVKSAVYEKSPLFSAEDEKIRRMEGAVLLEALALHGLNGNSGHDKTTARRLLKDLLRDNPSHALAADLLDTLDWGPG